MQRKKWWTKGISPLTDWNLSLFYWGLFSGKMYVGNIDTFDWISYLVIHTFILGVWISWSIEYQLYNIEYIDE
jgi:hypothetical protein